MIVKTIRVIAGRTFNHPYESYSNLRPGVVVTAEIREGEDYEQAIKDLQAKAEMLVEDHKRTMLTNLKTLYEMKEYQQRVANLESNIRQSQRDLEELRKGGKALLPEGEEYPTNEEPEPY